MRRRRAGGRIYCQTAFNLLRGNITDLREKQPFSPGRTGAGRGAGLGDRLFFD
uniref:Uncharacterized protein n=1 Tax=Anguilla anguilla TaxID=7936 RepID=A0A0E9UKT7_ANGAN